MLLPRCVLPHIGGASPKGNTRICNKSDGCVILLHECLFSLIRFRLPFNEFKVGVLNVGVIPRDQ